MTNSGVNQPKKTYFKDAKFAKKFRSVRVFRGRKLRRLAGNPLSDFLPPRGGGLNKSEFVIPACNGLPRQALSRGRNPVYSIAWMPVCTGMTVPEYMKTLTERDTGWNSRSGVFARVAS